MKEIYEKIRDFVRKNMKWILVLICFTFFIMVIANVIDGDIIKLDNKGYNSITKYLMHESITPIVKFITKFGGTVWLIGLALFLLFIIKDRKIGFVIALNLAIAASVNFVVKQIVQRPRPELNRIIEETGYSFPSGHSMVSLAFYGCLIYLICQKVQRKRIKRVVVAILSILILLIGISRIYLGVHYTSDVLAGYLLAMIYLIIYITIANGFIEDDEEDKGDTSQKQ